MRTRVARSVGTARETVPLSGGDAESIGSAIQLNPLLNFFHGAGLQTATGGRQTATGGHQTANVTAPLYAPPSRTAGAARPAMGRAAPSLGRSGRSPSEQLNFDLLQRLEVSHKTTAATRQAAVVAPATDRPKQRPSGDVAKNTENDAPAAPSSGWVPVGLWPMSTCESQQGTGATTSSAAAKVEVGPPPGFGRPRGRAAPAAAPVARYPQPSTQSQRTASGTQQRHRATPTEELNTSTLKRIEASHKAAAVRAAADLDEMSDLMPPEMMMSRVSAVSSRASMESGLVRPRVSLAPGAFNAPPMPDESRRRCTNSASMFPQHHARALAGDSTFML